MEGDIDSLYADSEDVDDYDGRDYFYDNDYDDHDESDVGDHYYDGDDVMSEDLNEVENLDDRPENDVACDQSYEGSDDSMSDAYDGSENADEDLDESNGSVNECATTVESDDGSEDQGSEDQGSEDQGSAADGVQEVLQEDEEGIVDENQSERSCGSEQEIFADAENTNSEEDDDPQYHHSEDYEDMDDDSEGDEIWDGDFVGPGPWQGDDTWDDVVVMGDDWYDYYDGDEVWDEDAHGGRFELRYEDYGGEAIPGEDGVGEVRDNVARDNFVTRTSTVTATGAGDSMQNPQPAGGVRGPEQANRLCPICLERLDAQEVGSPWNCQHYFCVTCILEWVRRSNTCPVDREVIDKIAVRCKVGCPVTRVVSVLPTGHMVEED